MDFHEIAGKIALFYIPFLFALCFHEFAHGLVAKWKGDNTAEMLGRLTLNPFAHADPIGTFLLPITSIVFSVPLFFGWAKPVPVNYRSLKNPRVDLFWIALAGPLSNVFLALAGTAVIAAVIRIPALQGIQSSVVSLLQMFILTNLFLAIFNIIPLHPLDGGKVIARFLPPAWSYKLEQNEHVTSLILMGLLLTGALSVLRVPVFMMFYFLMNAAGVQVGFL